ncbi:MAG: hypothetical protein U0452_01205 [Anaerolineae bacterium]
MFQRLDRSRRISGFIERLSGWMARRRGLPIVAGIGFIFVSFLCELINGASPSPGLQTVATLTLYVGLLMALIGIVLVEPLGG